MAAVRSLRVSVKPESASESDGDSDSDRDARDAEPMEVEEGEEPVETIPVRCSLKELLPDTSRKYENKAGTFITGIDVTSKEAVEKKEKRAQRFHFRAEESTAQRNVVLDKEMLKKAIAKVRLEALYVCGVDDMSTKDIFGFFKEYPPAHIEWIDDASCNVVWLDDVTSSRVLLNMSSMPDPEQTTKTSQDKRSDPQEQKVARRGSDNDDNDEDDDDDEDVEEGEVVDPDSEKGEDSSDESEGKASDREEEAEKKTAPQNKEADVLSQAEIESILRNDLRPASKGFKGNKLFLRFATQDDKKELGAARRSRYYMKYGNPNYGGMKGILSNSWKRRFHSKRIQRDILKTKKPLIGDSMGHTPPYTHRHSADLVNLPEEPIEEEEEEEEEEEDEGEVDMDADDRVVEYGMDRERNLRITGLSTRGLSTRGRSTSDRPSSPRHHDSNSDASSDSDEMDYDLELKMISTPSPKKTMKMTMYADEVEENLKIIRQSSSGSSSGRSRAWSGEQRGAGAGNRTKPAAEKVTDVRQLLEEKRQQRPQSAGAATAAAPVSSGKTDMRQRLGKRRHSPDRRRSVSPPQRSLSPRREPLSDVHSRLGVAKRDTRNLYLEPAKDKKSGGLWSRLGPSHDGDRRADGDRGDRRMTSSSGGSSSRGVVHRQQSHRRRDSDDDGDDREEEEEDDSRLQKVWGAMIKQKELQSSRMKKSRLDNLPSLQIEISRDSSNGSDSDS
ncbi:nuclear cap-binding protein subunit 3 isoform X3 [Engraulis encrasicolus]|uniref:nuclear cap-binding protein subunit 3 isoform X3 n=1 Tax=Engraulis encrasicolus TaxID=184585 RepID=UPI002FD5AECC